MHLHPSAEQNVVRTFGNVERFANIGSLDDT